MSGSTLYSCSNSFSFNSYKTMYKILMCEQFNLPKWYQSSKALVDTVTNNFQNLGTSWLQNIVEFKSEEIYDANYLLKYLKGQRTDY